MAFAITIGTITFLLAVIWGSPLVELMRRLKLGKQIRIEGPQSHMVKMGTPAMGGILIIGWVTISSIVVNIVQLVTQLGEIAESVLIPLGVMIAYAILGGVDDYMGFRKRPGIGMLARYKIWYQVGIALIAAGALFVVNDFRGLVAVPTIPFLLDIGWLYIPVATFIITGTSNAVNFVDGLDGLAGLTTASAFIAYGVIAFLQDQQFLVVFCFTVVGASFGFLWYNAKPAQMFMGDVGSQPLGGILAVVALMSNQWLILPIIAVIAVATTLSVTLQVSYFKWTNGKRLFRMAPLHHHFELLGWSETQIVQRWWLISILAAMAGIALALL